MIDIRNPYTPGAGVTPTYLAGRDKVVLDIEKKLVSAKEGYSFRPVIYYGLRGVGKTVLLNAVETQAKKLDILHCHIEVREQSNLIKSISTACNGFVKQLSLKETMKEYASKLKALVMSFSTHGILRKRHSLSELTSLRKLHYQEPGIFLTILLNYLQIWATMQRLQRPRFASV